MKALVSLCAAIVAMIFLVNEAAASRHHRRGDLFSNWCAYNCYRVSPCARGACLGRYHYSRYPYDEDLPFPYRWDRDASAVDNVLAAPQYLIGTPLLRAGERRW